MTSPSNRSGMKNRIRPASPLPRNSLLFLLHVILFVILVPAALTAQTPDHIPDPDPERFAAEITAYDLWDAKNATPDSPVLFTGSSSIRLWKTAEAFPGYPVINRGVGGSHIPDIIHYYDQVIGRYEPEIIIFYCGENDIASGVPAGRAFDDFKRLTGRILDDFPEVRFLYITIKNSSSRLAYSGNFKEFNELVEEYSRSDRRLNYIDLAGALTTDGTTPDDSFFAGDRLHLNERGYKAWNELLKPELDRLIHLKREPDPAE
jgi:lysophospholipase L1-like esterase